jgi:hypothetical protein
MHRSKPAKVHCSHDVKDGEHQEHDGHR